MKKQKTTFETNSKTAEYFDSLRKELPKTQVQCQTYPPLLDMVLAKQSPSEIMKAYSGVTLQKILQKKELSIGLHAQERSEEDVKRAICIILADLSAFFDGDINREQIENLADEIMNTILRNVRLEGLYLVCQDIKKSNITYKLKPNIVLRSLHQHLEAQTNLAGEMNYSNHISVKQGHKSDNRKLLPSEEEFLKNTKAHLIYEDFKNKKHER